MATLDAEGCADGVGAEDGAAEPPGRACIQGPRAKAPPRTYRVSLPRVQVWSNPSLLCTTSVPPDTEVTVPR